ncbi:GNAT family N-acetyltransferase [Paenibacillus terrae]|uniref:Histone acetyltransferase n=1 Tax=Paenibacillus terrae TaxID=159743 RepID=A0A0D7XAH9_9BACL|nr:GNAT family N-acetyltransferase [Paenibacillus terrae]KJD47187.1 histone acetyltransferase [Paenibacillus terrae]
MTLEPQMSRSSRDETRFVRNKLIEFNAKHIPEDIQTRYEEINLTLKNDAGQVIGGLLSVLCWNWVEVDILWIDQSYRGKGYGSQLLGEIEQIAKDKGCAFIQLNTFTFQAPDFYEKYGYEVIGVIDDAPRGFKHYYYKKNI